MFSNLFVTNQAWHKIGPMQNADIFHVSKCPSMKYGGGKNPFFRPIHSGTFHRAGSDTIFIQIYMETPRGVPGVSKEQEGH